MDEIIAYFLNRIADYAITLGDNYTEENKEKLFNEVHKFLKWAKMDKYYILGEICSRPIIVKKRGII